MICLESISRSRFWRKILSQDQYFELLGQLVKKYSLEHQLNPVLDDKLF
ncbi:MAG: hypothetical protein U9R69_09290 [Thermodesulfobacteriota bacterium]|nr:hypothetical protein [Thermodesulfobacteriota bacterium]